jgi:hypothetical protein
VICENHKGRESSYRSVTTDWSDYRNGATRERGTVKVMQTQKISFLFVVPVPITSKEKKIQQRRRKQTATYLFYSTVSHKILTGKQPRSRDTLHNSTSVQYVTANYVNFVTEIISKSWNS